MGCCASAVDASEPEPVGENASEPEPVSEEERFQSPEAFRECLVKGWVRLLRGSFLVQLHKEEGRLKRHQELPNDAFWDAEEAMNRLTSFSNREFLFVLSYRWLQPGNPDPQGHHLTIVAHAANLAIKDFEGNDIAIFWDFGSLPQKPRSTDDDHRFRAGLCSCDMLYGHRLSNVWVQTRLPEGFVGASYTDSGWCSFEAGVSSILKIDHMRVDLGECSMNEDSYIYIGANYKGARSPPLTPARFSTELEYKTFTSQADSGSVKELYRRTFHAAARSTNSLSFGDCGWGPAQAEVLAEALPDFRSLNSLCLETNPLGADGLLHLAKALPQCTGLTYLSLQRTDLDAKAIEHLAAVLPQMQRLEEVNLFANPDIGAAGLERLARALPQCQEMKILNLENTGIDAEAIGHLAEALPQMQRLETLWLCGNPDIGAAGLERLASALPQCQKLAWIDLSGTGIVDEDVERLRKAIGRMMHIEA